VPRKQPGLKAVSVPDDPAAFSVMSFTDATRSNGFRQGALELDTILVGVTIIFPPLVDGSAF